MINIILTTDRIPDFNSVIEFLNVNLVLSFVAGVIVSAVLILLMGRAVYLVFRPLRWLSRPVLAILRRLRLLPKATARTRPARGAVVGARAAMRDAPAHATELELALQIPDEPLPDEPSADGEAAGDQDPLPTYDFEEERRLLKTTGLLFKWLQIPGAYTPTELTQAFSGEVSDRAVAEAGRFLHRQVDLHVNPKALYEDAEAGVIVAMFRTSDRRAFFALDQMRRVVNGNAFRLVSWLWLVLLIPLVIWLAAPRLGAASIELRSGATIAAMLVAGLLMFFVQNLMYANQQRQNTREMSNFLARYLDRISDRFREASATASRVIQGDERDSKKLAKSAQKWIKILIWLPFRAFFIESFVRGVYFQVRRNGGYYLILGYALGIAAFALFFGAVAVAAPRLATLADGVAFGLLTAFYLYCLTKEVVMDELDQINWLGFDNLNMGKQIDEVVGKYAEDIGLWKGRFDR